MMMRERMDYTYKETSNKSGSKDKEKDGDKEKSKTTEKVEFATSFAQIAHGKKTCFICGGPHFKNDCPLKDSVPKEKWVINQMNSHFQQARVTAQQCTLTSPRSSSDDGTVASDPVRRNSDWTGVQHFQVELSMNQVYQLSENDKEIILDNGSTMSLFRDPSLVSDVAMATWPIEIATNAGRRIVTHKAKADGFGQVWYNEDAIANIFSLKDLIKKHKVTFDSSKENAFIVHRKNDIIKFPSNKLGLYTYEVPGSKAA